MPTTPSKLSVLKEELDRSIKWFHDEADRHKILYRRCRYSVFALMASATVLAAVTLALPEQYRPISNVAVVVVTALSGIITSVEGLRKPGDLWQDERSFEYALRDIRRNVEFYIVDENETEVEKHFQQVQAVLRASGDKWLSHIRAATQRGNEQQGNG